MPPIDIAQILASIGATANTTPRDMLSAIFEGQEARPPLAAPEPVDASVGPLRSILAGIADSISDTARGMAPNPNAIAPGNAMDTLTALKQRQAQRQDRTNLLGYKQQVEQQRFDQEMAIRKGERAEDVEDKRASRAEDQLGRAADEQRRANEILEGKVEDIGAALGTYGLNIQDYDLTTSYGRAVARGAAGAAALAQENASQGKSLTAGQIARLETAEQFLLEDVTLAETQLAEITTSADPSQFRTTFYRRARRSVGGDPQMYARVIAEFEQVVGAAIDDAIAKRTSAPERRGQRPLRDSQDSRERIEASALMEDILKRNQLTLPQPIQHTSKQ